MTMRILAAATMLILPVTGALAVEKPVTIEAGGRGLAGILNLPDGVSNPPVVLMLHGFTGQKNEFTIATTDVGLYAFTAQELAKAGIASLRVDFHGSGDSEGEWADTTFTGQIKDATIAFDYLQALPGVDGSKVGILGYSQGGLVGAHLAGLRTEASAVVLWAPVTDPVATYSTIMGADAVSAAIKGDAATATTAKLSWGGETTLKGAFFKELETVTPIGAISKYHGPLRVVVGKKETIVTPQPASGQTLLNYHEGDEDLVEIDCDHDWNAGTSPETARTVLVPSTLEWFKSHF